MAFEVHSELDGLSRLQSQRTRQRAESLVLDQMQRDMEPLVPKRGDGAIGLRASAYIDASQHALIYDTIYARRQFYGIILDGAGGEHPIHHYTTAGTGKRWDLRGKQLYGDRWRDTYRKGLLKRD